MPRLPWLLAGLVPLLLAAIYDAATHQGAMRLSLQALLAAAVACMHPRLAPPPRLDAAAERAVLAALRVLAAALALLAVGVGVEHVAWSAREGNIRLDIGQATHRAVQALRAGENPYAEGMILDPVTLLAREARRAALGYPRVSREELTVYWRTLDPALRARLLPRPADPTPAARREAALAGYKYGPADLLTAAPFVLLLGQPGIPVANLAFYLAFLALFWALLGAHQVSPVGRWLALVVVLADPCMVVSCLRESASDARALAPLALAMWAHGRGRPALAGGAVAFSLAMKLAPAIAFVPLVAGLRSWRAAAAFAAVLAACFAPFAAWDAYGLLHNVLLWAFLRESNVTSWVHGAPGWLVVALRAVLAVAAAGLAARLILAPRRTPLRDLALLCLALIAAGSTSHNNYLPWVTWLAAGALATAWFTSRAPGSA